MQDNDIRSKFLKFVSIEPVEDDFSENIQPRFNPGDIVDVYFQRNKSASSKAVILHTIDFKSYSADVLVRYERVKDKDYIRNKNMIYTIPIIEKDVVLLDEYWQHLSKTHDWIIRKDSPVQII